MSYFDEPHVFDDPTSLRLFFLPLRLLSLTLNSSFEAGCQSFPTWAGRIANGPTSSVRTGSTGGRTAFWALFH